jgi:dihydroflavonol-4-reductase
MLGHHAALAAQAVGDEVVVLHRANARLDRLRGLKYQGRIADLDDPTTLRKALEGLDGVINAAAYYPTAPRPYRKEVATALEQMGAFYDACEQVRVPRVLYVGGSIALRRQPEGRPGDETLEYTREPDDKNPYLQVKWAMDRLARSRADDGLQVVIGIPTMSFGEHDWGPTTGRFVVDIANRSMPAYVPGLRNAVYAGDAGRGLLLALKRGVAGERYLLTGENVSMEDLVGTIADLARVPRPRSVPLSVARGASQLQELRYHLLGGDPPKLSATAIAVMSAGQFLDGTRAERVLGYRPEVPLAKALERALEWFRRVGYVKG